MSDDGKALFRARRFEDALHVFVEEAKRRPSDGDVFDDIARCYSALNRWAEALDAWDVTVDRFSERLHRANGRARSLVELGDHTTAASYIDGLRQRMAPNATTLLLHGVALLHLNATKEAERSLREMLALPHDDSHRQLLRHYLQIASKSGRSAQVAELLTDLGVQASGNQTLLSCAASNATLRRDWDALLKCGDALVKAAPNSVDGYVFKLNALLFLGGSEFETFLAHARSKFPNELAIESFAIKASGISAWRSLAADAATTDLPSDFEQLNAFAMACLVLSRFDDCHRALMFALTHCDRHYWFLATLAELLCSAGRTEESLPLWKEAQEKAPASVRTAAGHVQALLTLRRWDDARAVVRALSTTGPTTPAVERLGAQAGVTERLESRGGKYPPSASWLHCGDLGDVVYALPAVRDGGGGRLYLTCASVTTQPMTPSRLAFMRPLLEAQPYVLSVAMWRGERVDHDFTSMRVGLKADANLAETQWRHVFGMNDPELTSAWLAVPAPKAHGRPVFSRSPRYRNPAWNSFWDALKQSSPDAIFVGTKDEYEDLGHGEHVETRDALELAQVIAGCSVFVGNQSLAYALAEGLKVKRVLEVFPQVPNCIFPGTQPLPAPDAHEVLLGNWTGGRYFIGGS